MFYLITKLRGQTAVYLWFAWRCKFFFKSLTMPEIKSSSRRYKVIDYCLRKMHYPTKEQLIQKIRDMLGERVSERTLEEDIRTLREDEGLGYMAPIKYDKRHKGYCYENPHFSLSNIPLKEEEVYSLEFAVGVLRQFKGLKPVKEFEEAVQKIEQYINLSLHAGDAEFEQYVQVEKGTGEKGMEFLEPLFQCIRKQHSVKLLYHKFEGEQAQEYLFHPYMLKEYRNRWYVLGFYPKRGHIITFALDRVVGLDALPQIFERDKSFHADSYFQHSFGITVVHNSKPEKVVLKFASSQSKFIKTQPLHPSQKILKETKTECRVQLTVIQSHELLMHILSYGAEVEVLQPATLREEIAALLQKAASQY